jgi:hypothetical protein
MKEVNYNFEETEVACDECGANDTIDGTNYADVNQELRNSGWIIKNVNGEWCDFCCFECYKKYIRK